MSYQYDGVNWEDEFAGSGLGSDWTATIPAQVSAGNGKVNITGTTSYPDMRLKPEPGQREGGTLRLQSQRDDGERRVKGIVNSITTLYVKEYYEIGGSTVRKYYSPAGSGSR